MNDRAAEIGKKRRKNWKKFSIFAHEIKQDELTTIDGSTAL